MTQSSVAVSADGVSWVVWNASPDIRTQLAQTPALYPRALRQTPISAVVLTNGDIDHVAGLLTLREKTAFDVYATDDIRGALDQNPMMNVLDPTLVKWHRLVLNNQVTIAGLEIDILAVPGKVPLYLEGEEVVTDAVGETTIGLMVRAGSSQLAYIPGCAALPDDLVEQLSDADLLLFDGTVWENTEMPDMGAGTKTGRRMGHLPMSGPDGSLARLKNVKGRKAYIHINNTNPVLQPDSAERRVVAEAGWDVCADGMEFEL